MWLLSEERFGCTSIDFAITHPAGLELEGIVVFPANLWSLLVVHSSIDTLTLPLSIDSRCLLDINYDLLSFGVTCRVLELGELLLESFAGRKWISILARI